MSVAATTTPEQTWDPSFEPVLATPENVLTEYERILLYGRGGTGKTFTMLTAPDPIWVLTPGGKNEIKTAFGPNFINKHGRKEFYVTDVYEDRIKGQMSDNPSGYDRCCDAVDTFLNWEQQKGVGIKTIAVDNATVLEEYMMNKAIMAEYILASSKNKTVLTAEREYGIRKPHDSTYGGAQSFMDRWINWLKELPYHLVFIAHPYEQYEQDEDKRKRKLLSISPLFVGAQRVSIQNKFDNVWYSTVMGGGRSLTYGIQPERDTVIDAKTRVGGILDPTYVRDPNITEILNKFKQYNNSLS